MSRRWVAMGMVLVAGYPDRYDFGDEIQPGRLESVSSTIPPDGTGLPPGSGTFETGKRIYAEKCSSCHGRDLAGTGAGLALIGGRGSLKGTTPLKTVESYWPYATSVFSYIRNAMPTTAPGSLSDSEVYALLAYILGKANIVSESEPVDNTSLPQIRMPNRDGFVPDSRPDVLSTHSN